MIESTKIDFRCKRAYEPASKADGTRVLIDRLWSRGVTKVNAAVDQWFRDLAPSTELRKWFGHDPARWNEFRRRYTAELMQHGEQLDELLQMAAGGPVTLVYGAHDEQHNDAVVLKEVLVGRARNRGRHATATDGPRGRKRIGVIGRRVAPGIRAEGDLLLAVRVANRLSTSDSWGIRVRGCEFAQMSSPSHDQSERSDDNGRDCCLSFLGNCLRHYSAITLGIEPMRGVWLFADLRITMLLLN